MAKEVFEVIRTAEQIKDALERCANNKPCKGCAYCTSEEKFMCTDALMNDTLKHIANLEAKVPKWVSVNDALPEHVQGNYLILLGGEIYAAKWEYDEWNEKYAFRIDYQIVPNITHWMKVLEPPEEEDHDELS